jgi:hypothetical protein
MIPEGTAPGLIFLKRTPGPVAQDSVSLWAHKKVCFGIHRAFVQAEKH